MAPRSLVLGQEEIDLQNEQADLQAEARTIVQRLEDENRDWTDEERERTRAISARLDEITARLKVIREQLQAIRAQQEWESSQAAARTSHAGGSVRITGVHDRFTDRPWGHDFGATTLHERAAHTSDATLRAHLERQAVEIAAGEFLQAVYRAQTGQGIDPRLLYVSAAQGAGRTIGPDGGFLVGTSMMDDIKLRMAAGEIFRRLRPIPLDEGTDGLEINLIDESSRATGSRHGGVQGYWLDEGTAPTASRPKFYKYVLRLKGLAALGYATNNLLRNARALGAVMLEAFSDELRFLVEDSVINGTGAGQPLGIVNAAAKVSVAKETGQAADTVVYENLSKMWSRMHPSVRGNAVWFINSDIEPQLDSLALNVGTGGLEPRFVAYGPDGVLRIKGRPVIPVEYCATLGDEGDIILANLDEYGFIEENIEQASSMHVAFTTNEMAFRVTYSVDGSPKWRSALTPFKGSATQSPFITLAAR